MYIVNGVNIQCKAYIVRSKVYSVRSKVYSVHSKVYSEYMAQCTTIEGTVPGVGVSVYGVHTARPTPNIEVHRKI